MNNDSGLIIEIDLNDLLRKESEGTLTDSDFLEMWTRIVLCPLYRTEQIIQYSAHTSDGYTSDQAVIYGLLVHICKLIRTDRHLTCKHENTCELASVLQRMIFESNITVQFLIKNPDKINSYRKSGLKGSKKFYEEIQKNREGRQDSDSDLYQWEEQILQSVKHRFDESGCSPDDSLPVFPRMYQRMKDIGFESGYFAYAMDSDIVHTSWPHVAEYSLVKKNGRYYPDFNEYGEDVRLLNPMLLLCYESLKLFITSYPGHMLTYPTLSELDEDQKLLAIFDSMHQNYLGGRRLTYGIEEAIRINWRNEIQQ